MNSKNHFLHSLGMALRGAFILVFALSVFTATTPTRAAGTQDLIIAKSHTGGNFIPQENGRTYTITVTNQGLDSTSGMVTVVDATPPATEMTVTNINGTGWTCTLGTLTCTRSDALGAGNSYEPITVTVNVLVGAKDPQSNQATVSGGGDSDTSNNVSDYNIPVNAKADLDILSYEIRDLATNNIITSPAADQAFYIRVLVANQGGATNSASSFYIGAFLDNKPNYGNDNAIPPGTVTPWSHFRTSSGAGVNAAGCLFYDPTSSINESTTDLEPYKSQGNYTRSNFIDPIDAGTSRDYDINIEYTDPPFSETFYDTLNIRSGLKAGTYTIYLYADTTCQVEESNDGKTSNNVLQISLTVTGTSACSFTPGGPQVFADVPTTHWARDYIEAMYYCGYTAGCVSSPLSYCPGNVMSRVESSVFILRGNFGTSYTPPTNPSGYVFADNWSPGPWGQKWAEGLFDAGLTAGCGANIFCPWDQTPRMQLAVFSTRLRNGSAFLPPPATGTVFADITDPTLWYAKWAEQAYADGLIPNCGMQGGKPLFCPNLTVDRALAAYSVAKAKFLVP